MTWIAAVELSELSFRRMTASRAASGATSDRLTQKPNEHYPGPAAFHRKA